MARQTVTYVLTAIALLGTVVFGQSSTSSKAAADKASASAKASADKWSVPRTPDGHPDFQGVWANNGMTPLERPKQFGLRATMTDAELADLKKRAHDVDRRRRRVLRRRARSPPRSRARRNSAPAIRRPATTTRRGCRTACGTTAPRSSSIRRTAGFRLPAPGAAERARAQAAAQQGRGPADRAQDLSLGTRCVSYGTPNIRAGYQSYFEITQGPGVVALRSEMIHDARIFSISAAPHVSPAHQAIPR